jgi:hypothetical protein
MTALVVTLAAVLSAMSIVIAVLVSKVRAARSVVVDIVAREVEKNIIKTAENAKLEVMDKAEQQIKVLQSDSKADLERKLNE